MPEQVSQRRRRRALTPAQIRERVIEDLKDHPRHKELRESHSVRARDIVEAVYQANAMAIALEQTRLALGARSEMVRVIAGDRIIGHLIPPEKAGPLVVMDNRTQIVSHMNVPEVAVVNGKTVELPPPPAHAVRGVSATVEAEGGTDSEPRSDEVPPPPIRSPGRPRVSEEEAKTSPESRAQKHAAYASGEKIERILRSEMKKAAISAADVQREPRLLTGTIEPQPREVPEKK